MTDRIDVAKGHVNRVNLVDRTKSDNNNSHRPVAIRRSPGDSDLSQRNDYFRDEVSRDVRR